MFDKVLIANRGEIALRIHRACREMGLQTAVIHSEADRHARYVALADQALCIGPASAGKTYLNAAAILLAAEVSGAQAVHPGYGFLSESADFADQVAQAGLIFIGPPADCIRTMGDKVAAKRAMRGRRPLVPGGQRPARRPGGGARDGSRSVPGDHQGGRRRRARHAHRARRA